MSEKPHPCDDPVNQAIWAAVKDGINSWRLSKAHDTNGSFEERFDRGDKQMLLWALVEPARRGDPIPEWAATKLLGAIFDAARGRLVSWDEAFGKMFEGSYRTAALGLEKYMFPVGRRVEELSEEMGIGDEMYAKIAAELSIGPDRVSEYYRYYRNFRRGKS